MIDLGAVCWTCAEACCMLKTLGQLSVPCSSRCQGKNDHKRSQEFCFSQVPNQFYSQRRSKTSKDACVIVIHSSKIEWTHRSTRCKIHLVGLLQEEHAEIGYETHVYFDRVHCTGELITYCFLGCVKSSGPIKTLSIAHEHPHTHTLCLGEFAGQAELHYAEKGSCPKSSILRLAGSLFKVMI